MRSISDEERKRHILEAALDCFLLYGYSKTSIDDVAKKAGLSRPMIYAKFKNKEDLFQGIARNFMETSLEKVECLLAQPLSKENKLMQMCKATILEPWDRIVGKPMTGEFYDLCVALFPQDAQKHKQRRSKFFASVIGDKELSDIFLLALEGLYVDMPSTPVLRRRIRMLVERFAG